MPRSLSVMAAHWSSENGAGGIQQFFETCQIRRDFGGAGSTQNAQNVKGKCKICDSIVSFSKKATSNLVTHVKRKHPEHYKEYARNKPQYVSLTASVSAPVPFAPAGASTDWSSLLASHVATVSATNHTPSRHSHAEKPLRYQSHQQQHTEAPLDYSASDLATDAVTVKSGNGRPANDGADHRHQQRSQHPQLNSALVRLVCGNLLPLHFVESNEFQEFINVLKPIRYTLPTQKDLSEVLLPQKRQEMEANLNRALRGVDSVCLTLDIWSHSRRWSFLGITAHFVAKDWGLGSAMLACKRFRGRRYTMEYIVQQYEEAVWAYGLQDKVVSIVTHNIADAGVGEACNSLPEMFLVEAFGNGNSAGAVEAKSDRDHDWDQDSDGGDDDDGSGCCGGSDRLAELECVDFTSELFLPGQEDCFSHSLHLAVKEGLQDCQQLTNILLQISSVLSAVRSVVGGEVASLLRRERRRLDQSSSSSSRWRWSAQLNMVRYVLKVIDEVKDEGGGGGEEVRRRMLDSNLDRHLLTEVLEILEPIEEASNFAESQDGVSISYVVPCVRGLVHHLESYRACHLSAVVEQLRASVLDRLLAYNERRNYLCGAMLDPRFKSRWARSEELGELTTVLLDEAEKLAGPTATAPAAEPARHHMSLQDLLAAPSPDKMARVATASASAVNNGEGAVRSVKREVDEYLSEPCLEHDRNPLHYWRDSGCVRFPALAQLARHLLPICASSAKVEQIFDADGSAFRSSQCWLSSKTFETMMAVKCNRVFWK